MNEKFLYLALSLTCLAAASCGSAGNYNEYLKVKNSNLKGEPLLALLIKFEVENTDNFESKVDLGGYYLLRQDYRTADYYFTRAQSVIKNAANTEESRKSVAILYGSEAYLRLRERKFEEALEYVNKAIEKDKTKELGYDYLKGKILYSKGEKDAALAQFERAYKERPEAAGAEEIDAMLRLYAEKENWDAALTFLDKYYEKGFYYPDFGVLASSIYEKTGDFGKSVLCAYLDAEYYKDRYGFDAAKLKENIASLGRLLKESGHFEDARKDFTLISAGFDRDNIPDLIDEDAGEDSADFFIRKYLLLGKKISLNQYNSEDVEEYLKYENFFKYSPIYYFNSWKGLATLNPSKRKEYSPILEKVISLKCEGGLDMAARTILGLEAGLNEKEALKLLIPSEVEEILNNFSESQNALALEKLYSFFELPDNSYVLAALPLVKSQRDTLFLRPAMSAKLKEAGPRLKERLNYILR